MRYKGNKGGAKRKVSTRDPIFGGSCVPKPLPLKDSNFTGCHKLTLLGCHKQPEKQKEQKLGVNKKARSIKTAKTGVHSVKTEKNVGKNRCKSTRMSEILGKWGTRCLLKG